jgi:erythromycin esterase-like protein
MLRSIRTVAAIAFLCLAAIPVRGQQSDSTIGWIRANAIRLSTPEAGKGFADMQALKPLIGNARIVSLGEATHGTREFFQLKHRMLEFLATEMGFTIFSIEANMPEAYRLNDYVLNGTGDPAELLRGMYFWTWNTEEVLDMIRWMRAFNASGRGRVQFTGFDMQTHTVALDIAQRFVRRYDSAYVATLSEASRQISTSAAAAGPGFGMAVGTFPLAVAAGKSVRFSGYIRTEGVTSGYAGLWWRVDGPTRGQSLAFDNMAARGATGTADWKRFTIELPVDGAATNINFGMIMPGTGTAWFDDLTIELDGQPYTDATAFDFGFESATPRGFSTSGNGYRITLDSTVARTGRKSLRMSSSAPAAVPAVDPRQSLAQWRDVVTHLETARARYRSLGATDRDIDWAIQNARVVQQFMEMLQGVASRDRSMALNIKWILDQNPQAKVVLWAHNGHSARGRMFFRSMGEELHDMYGNQMVVIGFGFNRGSFQAMGARGGGLQNFTVGPAPSGSFDALLAAAGIPLFALDLRKAPAALRETRLSRQIGAVFSNDTEASYMSRVSVPALFDAILFVENTTAARPVRR